MSRLVRIVLDALFWASTILEYSTENDMVLSVMSVSSNSYNL